MDFIEKMHGELFLSDDELLFIKGGVDITCGNGCGLGCGQGCGAGCSGCAPTPRPTYC
jgi:hypothetical protein